jgi:hypothetical protein
VANRLEFALGNPAFTSPSGQRGLSCVITFVRLTDLRRRQVHDLDLGAARPRAWRKVDLLGDDHVRCRLGAWACRLVRPEALFVSCWASCWLPMPLLPPDLLLADCWSAALTLNRRCCHLRHRLDSQYALSATACPPRARNYALRHGCAAVCSAHADSSRVGSPHKLP